MRERDCKYIYIYVCVCMCWTLMRLNLCVRKKDSKRLNGECVYGTSPTTSSSATQTHQDTQN